MTAIATDKLTPTVGALVEGVDRDRLEHDKTPAGLDARSVGVLWGAGLPGHLFR